MEKVRTACGMFGAGARRDLAHARLGSRPQRVSARAMPPAARRSAASPVGMVTILGYASVFERHYGWECGNHLRSEIVRYGAFDRTLAAIRAGRLDLPLLVDHRQPAIARTGDGTLSLTADEHGLRIVAHINPALPAARPALAALEAGAIGMSLAFGEDVNDAETALFFSKRSHDARL